VFTTIVDGQRRAEFDFYYRGPGLTGWTYLGSLSLPSIPPARAGEPDLELEACLDSRGDLRLELCDPSTGRPAGFVLEARDIERLLRSRSPLPPPSPVPRPATPSATKRRRFLLLALAACAALAAGGFALLRSKLIPSSPEAGPAVMAPAAEPVEAAVSDRMAAEGTSQPAAARPAPKPAAAEPLEAAGAKEALPPAKVDPAAAATAARYHIAWGDTLWRIAERYYGERGLYRELAESNALRDPDRITAGELLVLPPALADRDRKNQGE
jgi:LysM repeat protein